MVVNTCAFIEAARQESIDVALALSDARKPGARLVVTGCMAERYGDELAAALPEADAVVGFSDEGALVDVVMRGRKPAGVRDLLELPRPAPSAPWAYVKVAEGCDRACAFCAIPSFRGKQRSRTPESIEAEVRSLVEQGAAEIVLVAQDLAWYGRDAGEPGSLAPLLRRLDPLRADGLARVRLLYLYPSEVKDPLVSTMLELESVVPYFDLSLQHAAPGLLRSMKRWGSGERFTEIIAGIRAEEPDAAFRSSFIVGFPGETEADHDTLLGFLDDVRLDWAGFFAFSHGGRNRGREHRRRTGSRLARPRAPARMFRGAGADHRGDARRARRARDRRARRRGRRRRRDGRAHASRGAGDRRRRASGRKRRHVRPPGRDRARNGVRGRGSRSRREGGAVTAAAAPPPEPRDEAVRSERARHAGELPDAEPHRDRDPHAGADS